MPKKKTESSCSGANIAQAEAFATELAKYKASDRQKMFAAMEERIAFLEKARIEKERREAEARDGRLNDSNWNYKRVFNDLYDTRVPLYQKGKFKNARAILDENVAMFDEAAAQKKSAKCNFEIIRNECTIGSVYAELSENGKLNVISTLRMFNKITKTALASLIRDVLSNGNAFELKDGHYDAKPASVQAAIERYVKQFSIKADKYETYRHALMHIVASAESIDEFFTLLSDVFDKMKNSRAQQTSIRAEASMKCKALAAEAEDFTNTHIVKYLKRCEIRDEGD